jgi:formamidopyrimidine-DNA glycosylase
MTAMWGAMELYKAGQELERQYIKDMRPTPVEDTFTLQYFTDLIAELLKGEKRSVKSLLTQEQIIPGLGNSIAQDILFQSHLHPRHALADLSDVQRDALYDAIVGTVREVISMGGRSDEIDLYGEPGGYTRVLDSRSVGHPCPRCQAAVQKMQYLGGACYFCPQCQV